MSKKKDEAKFIDRDHCINCGSLSLSQVSGGLFGDSPLRELIENDPWGECPMPFIENKNWSYVECNDCNQTFHRFVLAPDWNEIRFSDWMTQEAIQEFEASTNTPENHFNTAKSHIAHILRLEKLTRAIRGSGAVRLLDFGCGWGEFLATADRFGFTSIGIDRSSGRRSLGQHSEIFPSIKELIDKTNPSIQFHAITLFEVLEHVDEPLPILLSLADLLVPGGILVLETPDCTNVTEIDSELSYRKIHPLDHINGFTPKTLTNIARRAGFRPAKDYASHVTVERAAIFKAEVRRILNGIGGASTQRYFTKI
jgi:SAM-dependent methyltransferase